MTRRARFTVGLGMLTYAAAWAFGSKPLYPVAVGLVLSAGLAKLWVALSDRPTRLTRRIVGADHVEGDDVQVELQLDRERSLAPGPVRVVERIAKLGERTTPLSAAPGRLSARYVLSSLPRGRYVFEETKAVIEDPFGLERAEIGQHAPGALLVHPRLTDLDRLFSEGSGRTRDGRRLLLRRQSGFDFHSVREYEQGESLRRVHWRATAKRGQLMVKELEDAPRDEIAVLLDADAATVMGEPPDSSFDLQVRAAGSILQAHARRGRRALLVVNSALVETQRVHSCDGDWRRALELLASVEPTGRAPLAALLADDSRAAARALELTVVTASLPPPLVDRLVQRVLARRSVALVLVDSASFRRGRMSGRGDARRDPALLRLQAAGIAVAVLERGDDLAVKLGKPPAQEVAHG
jgi:uncharacterized protein (DUF58 family)